MDDVQPTVHDDFLAPLCMDDDDDLEFERLHFVPRVPEF